MTKDSTNSAAEGGSVNPNTNSNSNPESDVSSSHGSIKRTSRRASEAIRTHLSRISFAMPPQKKETAKDRDIRIRKLFQVLDVQRNGRLDLQALLSAFRSINHPFQHSPEAVREIFLILDSNNDNIVEYEEFKSFVEQTESHLRSIFQSLDVDKDGELHKADIRMALKKVGIQASEENVDTFFAYMDKKGDGKITFDEFVEFLLFVPVEVGDSLPLAIRTAYRYFIEDLDLNPDGDVTLTLEGLHGVGYFLAGGLSGVVSRTCTAPFDRLKVFLIARTDLVPKGTKIQKKTVLPVRATAQASSLEPTVVSVTKRARSPLLEAAKTLWRQGGIRAFYTGNGLNALKVFPESAIKFGSFEAAKRFFGRLEGTNDPSELSQLATFLSGGFAGVVAQFVVYPIDTVKFRVQCESLSSPLRGNALLRHTIKSIYAKQGFHGYYRGILVGVGGIFPYAALDLGTFTALKRWYISRAAAKQQCFESEVKMGNLLVLSMGALSGCVGATMVYPINLLRTRIQAQGTAAHPYTYTGLGDVFRQTVAREGYKGLFKGLVPNLAKVAPAVSISYLTYENLKRFMKLE